MKRALGLLICLILAFTAACGGSSNKASDEDTRNVLERDVNFKTSDGVTLTGRLFGTRSAVGVTLAHMFPADARSWYPAARKIAAAGYLTLAFNFRGFQDSQGPKQILKAPVDLAGAAAFLKTNGVRRVALVGASFGGTASIIEAAELNPLAVVAVSAPRNFNGLDATFAANNVQRPVMLIASSGDTAAFQSLQEYSRSLPNPDSRVYGGNAHGTDLLSARPEALGEIIDFLKRYAPLVRSVPTSQP